MTTFTVMPKYEAYKYSGIEWIGDIPAQWDIQRIKYVFSEVNTKSLDGSGELLSVSQYTGVTKRADGFSDNEYITNAESLSGYKEVKKGDLVSNIMLAWNGSLAFSSLNGITSPAYSVYRLKNSGYERYFHYLLRTEMYKAEYKRKSTGVVDSRLRLYTEDFFDIWAILPTDNDKKAIANFLDEKTAKIDEAIAIKEKQIELLKERKQIIIQQAVTQGLDPTMPMKESGVEWIGQIPAHWSITRLKFESEIQTGVTLGKSYNDKNLESIPYLRVANVQSGYFKLDDVAELKLPKKVYKRHLLQDKDILVTEGGDLDKLGRGTVWNSEIEPCIHQNHVFSIRVNRNRFSPEFLSFFLETNIVRRYFINTATKTTNLAATNRTHLGNLYLVSPPFEEQIEIYDFVLNELSSLQICINQQSLQVEKLKEYKTTLINCAVTGKIKVV